LNCSSWVGVLQQTKVAMKTHGFPMESLEGQEFGVPRCRNANSYTPPSFFVTHRRFSFWWSPNQQVCGVWQQVVLIARCLFLEMASLTLIRQYCAPNHEADFASIPSLRR
jgi:hypothetical protein